MNNFDLIRLAAAFQVLIVHTCNHFNLYPAAVSILSLAPGVPIFFFISGFLISESYEKSSSICAYTKKRALRIFPGLWVSILFALATLWLSGYLSKISASASQIATWVLSQATFLQFYNPPFFREYGVGVVNGALWTISVELQFYLAMPILAFIMSKSRILYLLTFATLTLVSLFFHQFYLPSAPNGLVGKLLYVSAIPWISIFMLGHLARVYWTRVVHLVSGKFIPWVITYAAFAVVALYFQSQTGIKIDGNSIPIFLTAPLAALVLSAAYSNRSLSSAMLKGNDISYGVYVYHLLVINFLIETNAMIPRPLTIPAIIAITTVLATMSWTFIEKPSLSFKPKGR